MNPWPNTEETLAAHVVHYLEDMHWDVYQEVPALGGVADIVAVQDGRVWIVECKRSFSFKLIEQSIQRMPEAHWTSVAVPFGRRSQLCNQLCKWKGLGLLEAYGSGRVTEVVDARLNRRARSQRMLDRLRPEHKTYVHAGASRAGHWSPFRETCKNVAQYVKRHEGCTPKELVKAIKHHYASPSSARNTIVHWVRRGLIEGVSVRKEDRVLKLYTS